VNNKPKVNMKPPPEYPCIYITPPPVKVNAPIEVINGQGLGSTIWKG